VSVERHVTTLLSFCCGGERIPAPGRPVSTDHMRIA
jgi:hypothetical protein